MAIQRPFLFGGGGGGEVACNITAGLALVVEKNRLQVFPLGSVFSYILNIRPMYHAVDRFA